jgi:tRNA-splicing ligase RtcB
MLPGIQVASMAMPDAHWGYGFPIGGVAAFDPTKTASSPGGVGRYLLGVRTMKTGLTREEVMPRIERSLTSFTAVPAGGPKGLSLSPSRLDEMLLGGASGL